MRAWILTVEFNNAKSEKESFTCQVCDITLESALFTLCKFAESVGINIGEYYVDAFTDDIQCEKGLKMFKTSNPFHAPFQIDKITMSQEEVKELQTKKLDEFN